MAPTSVQERPRIPGYELGRHLGTGSFGEVYEATQISTGQSVAVKVLSLGDVDLKSVRQEIDRLVSVGGHPNVLSLIDADLDHAPPYLITPRLNRSLSDVAPSDTPLEQLVRYFEDTASAMRFIHHKGILHCDLKPDNILLDSENRVKVVDFGQAHLLGEEGIALGTFWFMPPEQAIIPLDGDTYVIPDVSWDVYALGATMYRVLTGHLPRSDARIEQSLKEKFDIISRLERYREELPGTRLIPVRELRPSVDEDLAIIVEHCLQLDPRKRYGSMDEVLDDFQRRRTRHPLRAVPPTFSYKARRLIQREKVGVFMGLLAIVALVTGIGLYLRAERNARLAIEQKNRDVERSASVAEYGLGRHRLEGGDVLGVLQFGKALQRKHRDPSIDAPMAGQLRSLPRLVTVVNHTPRSKALPGEIVPPLMGRSGTRLVVRNGLNAIKVIDTPPVSRDVAAWSHDKHEVISMSGDAELTKVVVADDSGRVVLWDGKSPQDLPQRGRAVAMSADGSHLAILHRGLLHIDTEAAIKILPTDHGNAWMVWSADARMLAVATSTTLHLVHNGRPQRYDLGTHRLKDVHWAGNRIIAVCDDAVLVWLAGEPRDPRVFYTRDPKELNNFPVAAAALPDIGVAASIEQNDVMLPDGTLETGHRDIVSSMALSPDGQTLATASYDATVRRFDMVRQKPLGLPLNLQREAFLVLWSADGKRLMAASLDGDVRIWDNLGSGLRRNLTLETGSVQDVRVSDNGRYAVTFSELGARVWDLQKAEPVGPYFAVQTLKGALSAVSPDGSVWAVCGDDQPLQLYDTRGGKLLTTFESTGSAFGLVFSGNGRYLAVSTDREATLYDVTQGRRIQSLRHDDRHAAVRFAVFSRDSTMLATCGEDTTVRLWATADGRTLGAPLRHNDWVMRAVFSPDGQTLFTVGQDRLARAWGVAGGQLLQSIVHPNRMWAVDISPDGQLLATGCADHRVRVFDWRKGEERLLMKHDDSVDVVRFSSDGRRLLTASDDGTALIWQVSNGEPLTAPLPTRGRPYGSWLVNGDTHVLTATGEGFVLLFSLPETDSGSPEGLLKLCEMVTGRLVERPPVEGAREGRWLSPSELQRRR